jgi:uncharacterized membrane protein
MHAITLAGLTSNTFGYRFFFLLHILCVIVGFGSSFVYPILGAQSRHRPASEAKALGDATLAAAKAVTTPVIYAAIFTGALLVGVSEEWKFSQAWVSIALVLAIISAVFAALVHVPNLRKMNELVGEMASAGAPTGGPPPQAAELHTRSAAAARNAGIMHLLFLLLVIDMIWKPFL